MARYRDIPEQIEQLMKESNEQPRWVTVQELRTCFNLDSCMSPALSGFLQRISTGTFHAFPYRVDRVENIFQPGPPPRFIKRYHVVKRQPPRLKIQMPPHSGSSSENPHEVLTDYDVIGFFNRVLEKGSDKRRGRKVL